MEIEHINDDTIRVKIENRDLEERGITFLDLLGNQKQIESFFYSILEEVDIDEEFQESDAVTFQVMPNNNGLELFISKGAQFKEELNDEIDEESTTDPVRMLNEKLSQNVKPDGLEEYLKAQDVKSREVIFMFRNFEQVIMMAQEFSLESGASTLYKYKDQYYLHIVFFVEEMVIRTMEEEIAHILEFGEKSRISSEVLDEYAEVIMDNSALELIRHYFK
ncbi:adaptor protein MecA [Marinilactibacillus psychrotolerans]|uniref:Adapter protein MecA n=2 Tax=Marinilactibacillus psychrotolerans TaxID=191770 RepID=A0A511GXQ6_9LACT|nr:adaptor protein MecA [Marinilactibacillus psychrotolerans]TLQ07678.1 adaptor protein MecA [Marinilactibacillus psychrotolerans]SDC00410.1 adapter protein MecA 1/2 [Marinilactibacillus psychrotolerans]SJN21381.1 Negative regulator of genetic competence MecA [Marinilactibacillus psychrotolerans 42ea]GEL66038.1 adapter protein MecA [Marinilactibacillus psychrotolerans]GEQ33130.1 adapter protein MecA [Marinilactibacillus psychrotolerans]